MATVAVQNESEASAFRITRDGRKLTYEMRVLQQPQRARACGSGAKSSADRRPVDPPPVIELKVFEGDQKTDITFNHNANFFVYTTLEVARPIAQPRGQPISQPPVLTGSPVSGAALLDRPSPAAYFIFPDLSVRHEGKYRLGFNLFEELKDPKDDDATPPAAHAAGHPLMGGGDPSVHFRLEVRSKPFTVYSAKKFPGLTESTTLSRVVAEQGCRVRIRRDVRMRRRETKGSKDGSLDDDYASYSEPQSAVDPYRHPTIEQQQQQPAQSQAPPPPPPSHQLDQAYYASTAAYHAPPPPPHHQQPYAQAQVLPQYVPHSRPASQPQYQPVQAAPMAEQHVMPPAYAHPYGQQQQQQAHTRHPSLASTHDSSSSSAGTSYSQPIIAPAAQHPGAVTTPLAPMPPHMQQQPRNHYAPVVHDVIGLGSKSIYYNDQSEAARGFAIDNGYGSSTYSSDPRSSTPNSSTHSLPPLKSLQPAPMGSDGTKVENLSGANSVAVSAAASPIYDTKSVPNIYGMPSMSGRSAAASVKAGAKRGYDRVFDDGSRNDANGSLSAVALTNGARQDTCGLDVPQVATEEGMIDLDSLLSMKHLMYRRANGSMQTRKITAPGES